VKEFNKNFTEKSVAKAKLPSIFPIFPKCQSISENFVRSEKCGLPHFSSPKFSRDCHFVKFYKLGVIFVPPCCSTFLMRIPFPMQSSKELSINCINWHNLIYVLFEKLRASPNFLMFSASFNP